MILSNRNIKCAVASQFMVDPSHRGFAGIQIFKTYFSGNQAISYTDGANDSAKNIWVGLLSHLFIVKGYTEHEKY